MYYTDRTTLVAMQCSSVGIDLFEIKFMNALGTRRKFKAKITRNSRNTFQYSYSKRLY